MKLIVYILKMNNIGSWNGKWTGSEKLHCRVRKYSNEVAKKIMEGATELINKEYSGSIFDRKLVAEIPTGIFEKSWGYSWDDGWGCSVVARTVTGREAAKFRKNSAGFCNYEWMIDSIEKIDKIKSRSDE